MSKLFTFDDVLISPKFSTIASRKDVSLDVAVSSDILTLPIISANMDTITCPEMAKAMISAGGQAVMHRFCSIQEGVELFEEARVEDQYPWVSIGLGPDELKRAMSLCRAGATHFVVDVAHGAQQAVVDQAITLRNKIPHAYIMVGNFASADSVREFIGKSGYVINAVKVGVGPGSACTTRIKTGVGVPQLSAILNISKVLEGTPIHVVADGGMKTPGDIAKAIGAGAHYVMLGGMLSGTLESGAGEMYIKEQLTHWGKDKFYGNPKYFSPQELREHIIQWMNAGHCDKLKYRGSASQESYEAQGKVGKHRTSEGESFMVPYKGSVVDVLADIEGGLRSSMTYVGARTLDEFRGKVEFVEISSATAQENGAHGKK